MREIKFRVYSEELKKYSTLQEAAIYGKVLPRDNELKVREQYILEQFTGLYDKNRKEIYEGDIVKISEEYNHTRTIIWGNLGYDTITCWNVGFAWEEDFTSWDDENIEHYVLNVNGDENTKNWVVIGNIHEGENK